MAIGFAIAATAGCSGGKDSAEETAVAAERARLPDPQVNERERRPNILLIVADDMGYTDLGSFGGEIRTPNLDKLAYEGVRLTNFHVHPSCAPTRAALMSGTFPHVAGVGTQLVTIERFEGDPLVESRRGKSGYEGFLNHAVASIPEILQSAGYRTYMTGKWHLGEAPQHSPAKRGFDRSFELIHGSGSHFPNTSTRLYRENGETIEQFPENFFSTRTYTDKLISYIEEDRDSGDPWFGYLAYTAPHWPLQVPDDWLDKYAGHYANGYDELRLQRIARAFEAGVISKQATVSPGDSLAPPWDELDDEHRQKYARAMEIYASMVENMDYHVGRVVAYLEASEQLENTIIIFMSDNGAENFDLDYVERAPRKPDNINNAVENFGRADSFILYGPGWAQASMGPFGYHKGTIAEGGIRAAAFVNHASVSKKGGIENTYVTVRDLSATLLEIADTEHPGMHFLDRKVAPLEGDSFLSLLTDDGHALEREDKIFLWEHDGQVALVRGNWKYMRLKSPHGPNPAPTGWRLHNLDDDPGETIDMSISHPERVVEFEEAWERIVSSGELIAYPE